MTQMVENSFFVKSNILATSFQVIPRSVSVVCESLVRGGMILTIPWFKRVNIREGKAGYTKNEY